MAEKADSSELVLLMQQKAALKAEVRLSVRSHGATLTFNILWQLVQLTSQIEQYQQEKERTGNPIMKVRTQIHCCHMLFYGLLLSYFSIAESNRRQYPGVGRSEVTFST